MNKMLVELAGMLLQNTRTNSTWTKSVKCVLTLPYLALCLALNAQIPRNTFLFANELLPTIAFLLNRLF
jgi:hypothetical protein